MEELEKKNKKIVTSNYDFILFMLIVLVSVFGLVMIYSVSSYNAAWYYKEPKLYFKRQGMFLIVGLVLMIVLSFIDYRFYIRPLKWFFGIRPIWIFYILCLGLQGFVSIAGYSAGGSSRWIKAGIAGVQPSELIKLCTILFAAFMIQQVNHMTTSIAGFIGVTMYLSPLIILVAVANLSSAVIICGILGVICFVGSKVKKYYFFVIAFMLVFVAVFVLAAGYRGSRVKNWLNRNDEKQEVGQITKGLYAIASGGLWGKGLGNSIQKQGILEEAHTDMIFTVICEELGIFGAIMVIAAFLMLFWRLLLIALNAPDMYGGLIATGALTHVAMQVLLNIAVVTNSVPATGIPFPFISYGGSSLVVLMIEMGIVLSVSKYTNKDKAFNG